jgi:hypothetical protein
MGTRKLNYVFKRAGLASLLALLYMPLSAGISYIAYADDLGTSELPWKISLGIALVCFLLPILICVKYREGDRLAAYGLINLIGIFSIYYFFGIFAYFFFFVFAKMPFGVRWPAILGGIALSLYWTWKTLNNVRCTIESTHFVSKAFERTDDGSIHYNVQQGMRRFEKNYVEPSALPKPFAYLAYAFAPFYLILHRIIGSFFGTNGILFFLAVLGLPLSLLLISFLVRTYIITVALPLRIEREQNVRVVVDA